MRKLWLKMGAVFANNIRKTLSSVSFSTTLESFLRKKNDFVLQFVTIYGT